MSNQVEMASALIDRASVKLNSLLIALARMVLETRHGLPLILLVRNGGF